MLFIKINYLPHVCSLRYTWDRFFFYLLNVLPVFFLRRRFMLPGCASEIILFYLLLLVITTPCDVSMEEVIPEEPKPEVEKDEAEKLVTQRMEIDIIGPDDEIILNDVVWVRLAYLWFVTLVEGWRIMVTSRNSVVLAITGVAITVVVTTRTEDYVHI